MRTGQGSMRNSLTRLFWPILGFFEKGELPQGSRPSHRKILLAVGFLFMVLVAVSLYFALISGIVGAVIPIVIFSISILSNFLIHFLLCYN
jgi:hypothetical protein